MTSVRVLIVEDNPGDARVLQEHLLRDATEFETVLVATKEGAIEHLCGGGFEAVVLDLDLAEESGGSLVQELRDVAPSVPIIVLTGTDRDELARDAIRAGAHDYLPKADLHRLLLVRAIRHAIERQHALEERARVEEQLRQSQRMEAVGRLAGGIAHDFNNLLTVIDNFAELVLQEVEDRASAAENVAEILTASRQAATLTRQLLQFSRRRPARPRVLALNHQVERVRRMLERLLGADISLEVSLSPGDPRVRIDPTGLDQIIFNLAVNARDAMPGGGRLTIETSMDTEGPGSWAMIRVVDIGEGIPPEVLPQVFEPFFTTKDPERGTGLGLSTCHGIVTQAGGEIGIFSRRGEGTCVEVRLPTVDAPLDEQPMTEEPRSPYGSETVLVVEDEPRVRALAVRALKRYGYVALDAPDGEAALVLCAEPQRKIDLLLSDVVMPGMPGPQLVDRVRALRPGIRILYMSGYSRDVVANPPTLDAPFLFKPCAPDQLAHAVRSALDGRS